MQLSRSGNTLYVQGDFGYEDFRLQGEKSIVVDASEASWIVSNMGDNINLYPVSVYNSSDITLTGGRIAGEVSLSLDWRDAYVNSAAVFVRDSDNVHVEDWRISQAWDGVRFRGDEGDSFTADKLWLSEIRDDAIENDEGLSGTIQNSLLDGVMVGISNADRNMANQSDEIVTIENVLVRMETYLYKGKDTHMSPFKVYTTSPGLKIYDSVIAIEKVNHGGRDSLERAWDKTIDASGNYFLNLSDEPLPDNYPLPPKGFTVLQGAEARAFWETARSEWVADFTGTAMAQQSPEPVEEPQSVQTEEEIVAVPGDGDLTGDLIYDDVHTGSDVDQLLHGSSEDDLLTGATGDDVLIGYQGDDILQGNGGNDRLVGRYGSDILVGGPGDDNFRIGKLGESAPDNPDVIKADPAAIAFEGIGAEGGDVLDVRGIDANSGVDGDQAFVFGSAELGGLSVIDVDGDTHVRGNTDGGADFDFVVVIEDGTAPAADYAASDFLL